MRSFLYGILGLVIGVVFSISLLTGLPQKVTKDTTYINSENQDNVGSEELNSIELPTTKISTYRVKTQDIEKYKSDKVIAFGRVNPMLFYRASQPEVISGEDDGGINPTPVNPNPVDPGIDDEVGQIEDPSDIIGGNGDADKDVDRSVVEFDWKTYESSYVLPRGYLFGYNSQTKKLNVVDITTLEGEIIFNGKFPIDRAFYVTSSNFGIRNNQFDKNQKEFHKGLDIASPDIEGASVFAMLKGEVVLGSDTNGYGNYVIIDHGDYSTVYAHLKGFAENLKTGDVVNSGDVIGYVGNTGRSTGPHLHIEFDVNGVKLTPKHFLNLMLAR